MRGTHERNYVEVDTGYNNDGLIDTYVDHELPCATRGIFGVVTGRYSEKVFFHQLIHYQVYQD